MKQLFILCLIPFIMCFGQDEGKNHTAFRYRETQINTAFENEGDTFFYGDDYVLIEASAGGYISGTNHYGDLGKYQRFDLPWAGELLSLGIYFGNLNINGESDEIKVVIMNATGIGLHDPPGEIVHFETFFTDEIVSLTEPLMFNFDNYIPVQKNFFIGIEWTGDTDDEFAIYTDTLGQGDQAYRSWEKWSDGTYMAIDSSDSWNVDIDLCILAECIEHNPSHVTSEEDMFPSDFVLNQNYPNPFNPSTKIGFALPSESRVTLEIFNMLGQKTAVLFKNINMSSGYHETELSAVNLPSGVYIYKISAMGINGERFSGSKKMILAK